MVIKSYKPVLIISIIMLLSCYTVFYFFYDITYANAFFAGFIIILIDLLLLARYLKSFYWRLYIYFSCSA